MMSSFYTESDTELGEEWHIEYSLLSITDGSLHLLEASCQSRLQEEINSVCHIKFLLSHIYVLKSFSLPALIPACAMCSGVVFDTLTCGPRKSTPASL